MIVDYAHKGTALEPLAKVYGQGRSGVGLGGLGLLSLEFEVKGYMWKACLRRIPVIMWQPLRSQCVMWFFFG